MGGAWVSYVLLVVAWIAALATLLVFLESWFALTRQSRLMPRRATATHGVVSILVPLRGANPLYRRTIQLILDQSYPFIEVLLVYCERDRPADALVNEFGRVHSHVPVRPVPVDFWIRDNSSRIRALEHAQASVRGSWILVLDPTVALAEHAVESTLEFAKTEDLTAVALSPGIECRTFGQKLLAPSVEWFLRMIRVVDRGKERSQRFQPPAPFMFLHGHTHTVINKINKLPGVLNESGWTLWSYRVEGLRTFQGDGSGWISREGTVRSLAASLIDSTVDRRRLGALIGGSALIAVVSVVGIVFGLSVRDAGLAGSGVLYFSAFSYSLMATSYFFYARRLGAAVWFAPVWFLAHALALTLMLAEFVRSGPTEPEIEGASRTVRKVPTSRN